MLGEVFFVVCLISCCPPPPSSSFLFFVVCFGVVCVRIGYLLAFTPPLYYTYFFSHFLILEGY